MAVDGMLAGPLTPTGSAGYDPHGFTNAGPAGWLSWHADLGPGGYALVPPALDHGLTLAISGWDSPAGDQQRVTHADSRKTPCPGDPSGFQDRRELVLFRHAGPGANRTARLPGRPRTAARRAHASATQARTSADQPAVAAIWMVAGEDPPPCRADRLRPGGHGRPQR
ncbi:MAG: hypothetical protein R2838_05415 [Caldilineaceae bacterium]